MAIIKTKFDRGVEGSPTRVNIVDTGTEGTKVAAGTTGQRGSTTGQWRYNTTLGLFEGRNASEFKLFDTAPTVTGFSASNFESSALPTNITITGTNFSIGATVNFIDTNGATIASPTVTRNSSTELVAQIPNTVTSANEPHKVRVTNVSGLATTSTLEFNIDAAPAFVQNAGSLGSVSDLASGTHFTLTATDDEGDSVTFSETTSNLTNAGLTLNSNGTITGAVTDVSSDTTTSFTARASDGTNTTDRNFSITTTLGRDGSSTARSAIGGAEILDVNPSASDGTYYIDSMYSGSQNDIFGNSTDGTYSNSNQRTVSMSTGGFVTVPVAMTPSNFMGDYHSGNNAVPLANGSGKYYVSSVGANQNGGGGFMMNQAELGRYEFPLGYNDFDVQFELSSTWGFGTVSLVSSGIITALNSSYSFNKELDSTSTSAQAQGDISFTASQNSANNYHAISCSYHDGSSGQSHSFSSGSNQGGVPYRLVKSGNTFTAYINGSQVGTTSDITSTFYANANNKYLIRIGLQGSPSGYSDTYVSFSSGHIKVKNS